MSKPMYDAKLSTIASYAVWTIQGDKVILSFRLHGGKSDSNGKHIYYKRVVHSQYFSNHSLDTVRFDNKRYLIDSKVELVEAM